MFWATVRLRLALWLRALLCALFGHLYPTRLGDSNIYVCLRCGAEVEIADEDWQ